MSTARIARTLASALVSVYSGTDCLGHILAQGKLGFEAFDPSDVSLGLFPTQREAADAISKKIGAGGNPPSDPLLSAGKPA